MLKERPIYNLECPQCKGTVEATFPDPHIHNNEDMVLLAAAFPVVECQTCHQQQFRFAITGAVVTGPEASMLVLQTAWIAGPVSPKVVGATQMPKSPLLV